MFGVRKLLLWRAPGCVRSLSLRDNSKARTSAAKEVAEKIGFARDSFFGVLVFPSLPPPFCSLAARFGVFVLLLRHYSLGLHRWN
jgi:hypothetical protein